MRQLIFLGLFFVLFALAVAPIGVAPSAEASLATCNLAQWNRYMVHFMARYDVAQSTARGGLLPVILSMQDIKVEFMFDPSMSACGELYGNTIGFMALMEQTFKDFMADRDDWDARMAQALTFLDRVTESYADAGGVWANFQTINAAAMGNIAGE